MMENQVNLFQYPHFFILNPTFLNIGTQMDKNNFIELNKTKKWRLYGDL